MENRFTVRVINENKSEIKQVRSGRNVKTAITYAVSVMKNYYMTADGDMVLFQVEGENGNCAGMFSTPNELRAWFSKNVSPNAVSL